MAVARLVSGRRPDLRTEASRGIARVLCFVSPCLLVCAYVSLYLCIRASMWLCVLVSVSVFLCICVCMCLFMYPCLCLCVCCVLCVRAGSCKCIVEAAPPVCMLHSVAHPSASRSRHDHCGMSSNDASTGARVVLAVVVRARAYLCDRGAFRRTLSTKPQTSIIIDIRTTASCSGSTS